MQQQPCGMTVDVRNDHEFLGSSFLGERVDTRANRLGGSHDGSREHIRRMSFLCR